MLYVTYPEPWIILNKFGYILYFAYLENISHIFQFLEKYEMYFDKLEVKYDAGSYIQIEIIFEAYLSFVFDGRTEYAPFSL